MQLFKWEKEEESRVRVCIHTAMIQALLAQTAEEQKNIAQIDGFRKGKIPLGIIKRMYREEIGIITANKIVQKVLEKLVEEGEIEGKHFKYYPDLEGIREEIFKEPKFLEVVIEVDQEPKKE